VGHARTPSRYLQAGQSLVTEVALLGRCTNRIVAEAGR
jgi:acylpyruvate hydrolase